MKADKRQSRIVIIGICWIAAGIISLLIGVYLASIILCSCRLLIVNGSVVPCSCPAGSGPVMNVYIGIAAILLGIAIIAARRRLARLAKKARR